MRSLVLVAVCCLAFAACDRDQSAPPAGPQKAPTTRGVEIADVTPLPPGRRTHIAPTESGRAFWVQEVESGRETVFAIGDGGLPVATKFTNQAVLDALGQPTAAGGITALAAARDGRLYFYFAGGKGKRTLAAFGVFSPGSPQPRILMDAAALARTTGMGDALALARGSLVRVGEVVWLWLRHEDGYALLSLDESRPGAVTRRPFTAVHGPLSGAATGAALPRLTSSRDDLAAGLGNTLTYLDRRDGRLWRIDPLGEATVIADLGDLPRDLTPPALDESGQRLVLFAPQGRAFVERPEDVEMASALGKEASAAGAYPALIGLDGERRQTLGPAAFVAPPQFNVRSLAVPRLVRDRGSWLAYEPQTGAVLRLKVVQR
jgi:hypothetical protein